MKITKIRRNGDGDITNVLTDDGTEMDLTEAVALAKRGKFESVIVGKNRNGVDIIMSSCKADENEKLENLPMF